MIAQVLYTDNWEEIEEAEKNAEKFNLPATSIPKEKYGWHEYHLDIECIHIACINNEGNINIFLPSGKWILKFDEDLWNKIKEYLTKK